jgi:hypothetical protein
MDVIVDFTDVKKIFFQGCLFVVFLTGIQMSVHVECITYIQKIYVIYD